MSLPFWQRAAAPVRRGIRKSAAAAGPGESPSYYFQSDGSDIADWTTSGMYEDATGGNPDECLAVDAFDYGYIDAIPGETWNGKTLECDCYLPAGSIPLFQLGFARNSSGEGNVIRLDARTSFNSQFARNIGSWTAGSATGTTTNFGATGAGSLTTASWAYNLKIEFSSTTLDVYLNDVLEVSGATYDNDGTYISFNSGDAGTITAGTRVDNILIYDT